MFFKDLIDIQWNGNVPVQEKKLSLVCSRKSEAVPKLQKHLDEINNFIPGPNTYQNNCLSKKIQCPI
jgi:hypothetical protein